MLAALFDFMANELGADYIVAECESIGLDGHDLHELLVNLGLDICHCCGRYVLPARLVFWVDPPVCHDCVTEWSTYRAPIKSGMAAGYEVDRREDCELLED